MMQVEAYIGEIRTWAGPFAPQGWHLCDGTILPIVGNEALYSLISNRYGGDGRVNFALPDLRGRSPVNYGNSDYPQVGIAVGTETKTLVAANLPPVQMSIPAYSGDSSDNTPAPQLHLSKSRSATATSHTVEIYSDETPNTTIKGGTLPGLGTPISIVQPLLSICFIIAMQGIYPTRP